MAATEFTPELTADFYDKMSKRITARGETNAGRARSEALSRGLGGDPYEASAVGLARQGTQDELGSFDADLNYKIAGLNRDERLTKEGRAYDSEEAQKDRAFREKMAQMGYDWQGDQANTANRRSQQAAMWQIPLGAASKAAGAWAGGGF